MQTATFSARFSCPFTNKKPRGAKTAFEDVYKIKREENRGKIKTFEEKDRSGFYVRNYAVCNQKPGRLDLVHSSFPELETHFWKSEPSWHGMQQTLSYSGDDKTLSQHP